MDTKYLKKICIFVVLFACFAEKIRGQQIDNTDLCKGNPCSNKGLCVQTHVYPGYKCQCYGTGFHGPRCKQVCPKSKNNLTGRLPIECIEI